MKKVLKFFLFLLLPLLVAGLVLGLKEMGRKQETRRKAAGEKAILSLVGPASANAGQEFFVDVFLNPNTLEISAASVSTSFPTGKLLLKEITAGPFFKDAFDANPGKMEMLKLGISCQTDADCRPDDLAITPENTAYKDAIRCKTVSGLKICVNGVTQIPAPAVGKATVILGAPCPRTDLNPPPAQVQCVTRTGSTSIKFATFEFQALAAAPSGAAAISFDVANTQVAAVGQTTNMVDTAQLNPVSVNIVGTSTDTILNFSIKFQGITGQGLPKNVTVKIKGTDKEVVAPITSNTTGVYSGSANLGVLTAGTNYVILIRGNNTLWKKFSGVTLNPGTNTAPVSWTATGQELKVGDTTGGGTLQQDQDNTVDGADISGLLKGYNIEPIPAANIKSDFNADNIVDGGDISLLLKNYNTQGDQ